MKINYVSGGEFQSFYANRQCLENKVKISASGSSKEDIKKNKKLNEDKTKKAVVTASFFGAVVPVVISNILKGKGGALLDTLKNSSSVKNKLKAGIDMFEIKDFGQILASTSGGIAGGITAGVITDKNPNNREPKYREGIFEFLNNMIPTSFVALGEHFIENYEEKLKSAAKTIPEADKNKIKIMRAALIAVSVAGGMFIANKTSNKINEDIFDKNKEENDNETKIKRERKFKIQDCFVHLDDLIGLFVLSKSPALNKIATSIQMDKILPFLYAKSGYEAGISRDEE